tara:strand:+ start:575 stop:1228 length:654 start_codon:yes stop_codon:yes gene_type:complete
MAANHIGNLDDTPRRTLEAIQKADLLIFEEDRTARKLLKAAKVFRPYLKYNEHHQKEVLSQVRRALNESHQVAYISDQGNPCLADPGRFLVAEGLRQKAQLKVIPGPSSITSAISACPFDMSSFHYEGFLPQKTALRAKAINLFKKTKVPVILLDTPYRREALLEALFEAFSHSRKALIAIDISGPEEVYHYGTLSELKKETKSLGKLNFVLIIEPS